MPTELCRTGKLGKATLLPANLAVLIDRVAVPRPDPPFYPTADRVLRRGHGRRVGSGRGTPAGAYRARVHVDVVVAAR